MYNLIAGFLLGVGTCLFAFVILMYVAVRQKRAREEASRVELKARMRELLGLIRAILVEAYGEDAVPAFGDVFDDLDPAWGEAVNDLMEG
jgi:hypothetical protein